MSKSTYKKTSLNDWFFLYLSILFFKSSKLNPKIRVKVDISPILKKIDNMKKGIKRN